MTRSLSFRPTRRNVLQLAAIGTVLWASGRTSSSQEAVLRAKAMPVGGDDLPSGFDGKFPGPILRATRGKPISARFGNDLQTPVTIYFPGLRGASGPLLQLQPGETRLFEMSPRDAGTFWYRALPASRAAQGLAGLLIVDDGVAIDRDIPLVLAALGTKRTANGEPNLEIPVRGGDRTRLRVLNGSPTEMLAVRIDQHDVNVMALDGHPSEPFIARDGRVPLAPGNRADLIVDIPLAPGASVPIQVETMAGTAKLVVLKTTSEPPVRPAALPPPASLPANPLAARMEFGKAQRLEFALGATPPSLAAKRGQTVMLAVKNETPAAYAVHIGGTPFRLLDSLDDGWKPYWLDTVVALPGRTTRVAFVAEATGAWPIICQPLQATSGASIGTLQIS